MVLLTLLAAVAIAIVRQRSLFGVVLLSGIYSFLIASVMIPLGKLIALAYLLITVQRGSIRSNRDRTRLYRMVEIIGRWSMLDVFVDTFTVALVQLQPLMAVEPGPGVVFFMAVVILTVIGVQCFDPRLIWDAGRRFEVARA